MKKERIRAVRFRDPDALPQNSGLSEMAPTVGKRISMQDVAERMGLSRSTFSLALAKHPRISVRTRLRVEKICKEIGYRPNSIISELASARWQTSKATEGSRIAYVDRLPHRSNDEFFFKIQRKALHDALQQQANFLGYQVEVFYLSDIASSDKLQRLFHAKGITEVILGPSYEGKQD